MVSDANAPKFLYDLNVPEIGSAEYEAFWEDANNVKKVANAMYLDSGSERRIWQALDEVVLPKSIQTAINGSSDKPEKWDRWGCLNNKWTWKTLRTTNIAYRAN